METALQRAVSILGSQSALGRAIGKKQQHIQYWLNSRVPGEYVIAIERATSGQVTRHDLRPDLYPIEEAA